MTKEPHLRAVPNPTNGNSNTRDLVKTVLLTSAVSSLVGVFAVAGGQALLNALRGRIKRKEVEAAPIPQGAPPPYMPQAATPPNMYGYPYASPPPPYHETHEDMIPESLRMEPRLRHPTRKRKASPAYTQDQLKSMFKDFESRIGQRLDDIESKLEDDDEEEDDE